MSSRDYLERRESEARDAADRATDERARKSHLDMAKAYRAAAESEEAPAEEEDEEQGTVVPADFRII